MNSYTEMAIEMFHALDCKRKGPPFENMNTAIRGEMAVLRLLEEEKRTMSAGDISRALEMTTSRIAAVLASLVKKGLIIRQCDPGDRRRVLVSLTEQGVALCRKRKQRILEDMRKTLEALGEEDAAQFVRLLKRVVCAMPAPPMDEEEE